MISELNKIIHSTDKYTISRRVMILEGANTVPTSYHYRGDPIILYISSSIPFTELGALRRFWQVVWQVVYLSQFPSSGSQSRNVSSYLSRINLNFPCSTGNKFKWLEHNSFKQGQGLSTSYVFNKLILCKRRRTKCLFTAWSNYRGKIEQNSSGQWGPFLL